VVDDVVGCFVFDLGDFGDWMLDEFVDVLFINVVL